MFFLLFFFFFFFFFLFLFVCVFFQALSFVKGKYVRKRRNQNQEQHVFYDSSNIFVLEPKAGHLVSVLFSLECHKLEEM